ncbi:MAG: phospho-N-acetylmuramoyl-pentapeptide-transferase [Bacillales bacterium]|nr:phospho-N-acetylmuramoyl-pentapeptide-transferase [Bacillales bacterium]
MTKSVLAVMIGFLFSLLIGMILIPYLKEKAYQRLNMYLIREHRNKEHTPTMGGFIFIIPTIITTILFYFTGKISFSYNLLIIFFVFIGYAFIGFLDDYLIIKRNNNKGLSESSKLFLQTIVALVFFYLFNLADNESLLWIHAFHIKLDIGFLYGLFILLCLIASSNAVNITDGLDGLSAGLSIIALSTFGIITWNTDWLLGYSDIAIFIFILVGSILGFLVYNVNPARIFMGDTGSLSLGATLASIAILTRHELLLIVIGLVFVIEMLSVILQRYYYKLTKKRIFPMAPIHHSFEKWGYTERDIVKLFWIVGFICSMIAIVYGVWL